MASTLSLDEAAIVLKTSAETVNECILHRGLPAAKIGRAWVLVDEDVIAWVRSQYGHVEAPSPKGRREIARASVGDTVPERLSTADIAALLGVSRKHATNRIVTRPDFPPPAIKLSQISRRWDRDAVLEYLKPPGRRRR